MKMIHRCVTNCLWVLAIAAITSLFPQNAYAVSAMAQQVQGDVMIQKAGATSWEKISQDTTLGSGDSLRTEKGTCSLTYSDQATFSVEENTSLTVQEKTEAQDIKLLLGKIKGKVNKQNAQQPFVVNTPAAVATVRGTEVDFAYNAEGQLVVDLHNGKIDVVNDDAELKIVLEGKKSLTIKYDKEANLIRVKNECGSDGEVKFSVLGAEYSEIPCGEKEISLSTSEKGTQTPDIDQSPDNSENIEEGREPISPTS